MSTFREIMADTGYELKTSFWEDFSIAEKFGESAIKDTYRRAFAEWKDNVEFITELALVLNHKTWQHYDRHSCLYSLYDELWCEVDQFAAGTFEGDDAAYYFQITD